MAEEEYMSDERFQIIKEKLEEMVKSRMWEIPQMVACVYDLYQEYEISVKQEEILYEIADPFELYNEPSKYYEEMDFNNPLL